MEIHCLALLIILATTSNVLLNTTNQDQTKVKQRKSLNLRRIVHGVVIVNATTVNSAQLKMWHVSSARKGVTFKQFAAVKLKLKHIQRHA